ncbi:hypothetical protein PAHA111176_19270 [Parendozoicomonas haliclonae]|uniref:Uncharacterized protein n=1 Tax=Parendozoicomonas haliclonae TaxID=1960125 RepID=A0A1X7APS7_9GAMM|nr:hypothetical protein EHSB41UT_04090 [Parendozoicomonas haliclonae]
MTQTAYKPDLVKIANLSVNWQFRIPAGFSRNWLKISIQLINKLKVVLSP